MPQRSISDVRSLALVLSVLAGSTLSFSALADDGGASGMDNKPAAAAPAAKADDAAPAAKSDPAPAASDKDAKAQMAEDAKNLADFVHFVIIDRPDVAKSYAESLLARNLSAAEFARMVDNMSGGYRRFSTAVTRAQKQPGLESTASSLLKLYEGGKLAAARDQEAISANIKLLTGDSRQRAFAADRLIEAGEYAVPQLLNAFLSSTDPMLATEVRSILVRLGRHSVMPLATALPKLQPSQQEQVAGVLGDMPQTHALPFLYDLSANTSNESVRNAADNAIRRISSALNPQMPLADRYTDLAEAYLKASPSLMAFPNDAYQLVWNYEPATGLTFQAVDAKVFPATMAMHMAELALRKDAASSRAVSTWIAANFTRELRTPEGYENPAYDASRQDAMYYAVAAGPSISQMVLSKALSSADTPLARKALAALEKTGGRDLWAPGKDEAGRRALLDALKYPNRRVQYEAALAIGAAQPRDAFTGAEGVVRTLASSIRDAEAKYALVFATSTEQRSGIADLLRGKGFKVLASATSLDEARQAIADAPGVDLIIANLPSEQTGALLDQSLNDARLRATPILTLVSSQGYLDQYPKYARDVRVRMLREGVGPADVEASAMDLINAASGGLISGDEAEMYKARSLGVLRDLAVSGSPVLNVIEAQGPLVGAMADAKGAMRNRIAEVLSYVNTKQSQVTLADAALNAEGDERTILLGMAASGAKRFGNQLDERQVNALVDLAKTAKGDEAVAAAALLGALNLQGQSVVPLILNETK